MTAGLVLQCSPSLPVLPSGEQPRLVYLLLEVSGEGRAQPLPTNLAFAIDISDSMRIRLVSNEQFLALVRNGQAQEIITDGVPAYQIDSISEETINQFPRRIDFVSRALAVAGEYLRQSDRFSLVAFASRASCMIPATSGKDRSLLNRAAQELEYLRLGDETHMAEGIAMAFEELQQNTGASTSNRLILLTDGHTKNVNECYEWAQRCRQAGVKLTTMGIGSEFNEDLLIPLADMTGGNAYYIETPEKIPEAFSRELGAALRISYLNVEIKLQLPAGVDLRNVYRVLPELSEFDPGPNMEGSYALLLGDFDPAAPVGLVAELVVAPRPPGSYRLAQALLSWEDPLAQAGSSFTPRGVVRKDVVLEVANLPSATKDAKPDGRVMSFVDKVGAFKMGTLALRDAQQAAGANDPEAKGAATIRLREAATRLLDMGEATLSEIMARQADFLQSSGNLDKDASKKFRYETRRITQH